MKKGLLYLLLFSYSTVILKPVLPTISDTVAHIFWYSEHMATVHYEHGKYHVHMEYTQEAKKGYPEKNNSLKEDDSANLHLQPLLLYDFAQAPATRHTFIISSASLPVAYQTCNYPPPKAA